MRAVAVPHTVIPVPALPVIVPSLTLNVTVSIELSMSANGVPIKVRFPALSSVMATLAGAITVGASFTAEISTETCTALADANWPSQALTVNAFKVPLAFDAGVHTKLSPLDSRVVPAVTTSPPFVRVPELTASIRKLRESPSTSASFAAAASVE